MSSSSAGLATSGTRLSTIGLLALPLAGFLLLLVRPELDAAWEHHPSHFWLVLTTAAINVALAYVTNVAAERHRDARVMLVSLAFLASAGFLGLHALATPGVLLDSPNIGFAIATPLGLFTASIFAAASVSTLAGPRSAVIHRYHGLLRGLLVGAMVAWAVLSLAQLPPLNGAPPSGEAVGAFVAVAGVAIGFYAYAAWQYIGLYRERGGVLPFAVAVAFALLGEATLVIVVSRNWHLSWWEWHLLMLGAFLAIAFGVRDEYQRSRSLTAAFGGLYLEATLEQVDRWHAQAIGRLAAAESRGEAAGPVLADLQREGASADEIALLAETSRELWRLDSLFRPYLPAGVASELRRDPALAQLGGEEREVTVLFADLAAFTTFSERHRPAEVIAMLNRYWAEVVPVIDSAGGVVEYFAGDGVLAIFNVAGVMPDHASRAVRAGLALLEAARPVAEANPTWPVFRVGVTTGPAIVGNVGAAGRRSFTAIGDTTNTAARLLAAGEPGQVVVSGSTWHKLPASVAGVSLGRVQVKGKRDPVEAWVVMALDRSDRGGAADR